MYLDILIDVPKFMMIFIYISTFVINDFLEHVINNGDSCPFLWPFLYYVTFLFSSLNDSQTMMIVTLRGNPLELIFYTNIYHIISV